MRSLRTAKLLVCPTIRGLDSPQLWLEKELQASFFPGTDILRIWLSGENPNDITFIVNKVRLVFKEQSVIKAKDERVGHLETLKNVINKAEIEIDKQRDILRKGAGELGSGDTEMLTIRQRFALDHSAQ